MLTLFIAKGVGSMRRWTALAVLLSVLPSCRLHCTAAAAAAPVQCETNDNAIAQSDPSVCEHFGRQRRQSYIDWYNSRNIGTDYPQSAYFRSDDPERPQDGVAVHWKVSSPQDASNGEEEQVAAAVAASESDTSNQRRYVHLAVAARATGWLAFGISEVGGMLGADMVMFTAEEPNRVVDAYTLHDKLPRVDDNGNHWEFVSSHIVTDSPADGDSDTRDTFLMFQVKRLLNTNDPQDRSIVNDQNAMVPPHRVIAAWGDQSQVSYHGLNRSRGAIRFFGNTDEQRAFRTAMMQPGIRSFDIRADRYTIPATETTYERFCVSKQQLIDNGLANTDVQSNIVGFEPIITPKTAVYVHHFVLYSSPQGECGDGIDFTESVFVWAPGDVPFALPDFLGIPLFGSDGHQAFTLEIHYNNPLLHINKTDSSGVRVYWTYDPREEQMGVLVLGDVAIQLRDQRIGAGYTRHLFECSPACSELALSEPVTVLREYLHMHQKGARVVNEQIRDGSTIRQGSIDFWEFDQNGNAAVQQEPFQIIPGDGFRTSCYYYDQEGQDTVFGLSSQEEMCAMFLYYYPRIKLSVLGLEFPWACVYDIPLPVCNAEYVRNDLERADDLGRLYGTATTNGGAGDESDEDATDGGNETSGDHRLTVSVSGPVTFWIGFLWLAVPAVAELVM